MGSREVEVERRTEGQMPPNTEFRLPVPRPAVGQHAFVARPDILALLTTPIGRVLDVGCGPGLTGEAVRVAGAREVWGLERDPELAEEARRRLDHVICSDLGTSAIEQLPTDYFDTIIYADVLEHLVDPWAVLKEQIVLLAPGGTAVISLPNVRHLRVLAPLILRGEWVYTDEGLLSVGHLRFFTTRTMRRLIRDAGYSIDRESANYGPRGRLLARLSLGLLDDILATQRLFVARRSTQRSDEGGGALE